MLHPAMRSAEQDGVVAHYRRMAALWVQVEATPVVVGPWKQSQEVGDLYTGYEVKKAYNLTWRAIQPHVPGPGEAGRINLAEVVSPELRPYVEDPSLLRIADEDLTDVTYSAMCKGHG